MKFGALLKKELSQLLTKQAILSMAATMLIFIFMGQFMGSTMEKLDEDSSENSGKITVICCDDGEFVKNMFDELRADGVTVNVLDSGSDRNSWKQTMDENSLRSITVIPEGFSEKAEKADLEDKAQLIKLTSVDSTGLMNMIDDVSSSSNDERIYTYMRDYYAKMNGITTDDYDLMDSPLAEKELTAANGAVAEISPSTVSGILMAFNSVMPFAIFILLMMASTMIMTAISTEKIDKTLETLLSAPVSRVSVLVAKVLAALITALINSLVTTLGFGFYMISMMNSGAYSDMSSGMSVQTAEGMQAMSGADVAAALAQLGINISFGNIALVFFELFITIAIGLCLSLIVGAMATDAQSLQTLLMPVMFLTMIPFFVTMFADVSKMGIVGKVVMFIIPFTHAYTAMGNIVFGHTGMLIGGLIYQLVFLGGTMYAAVKIFTTDLLFTMKLPEPRKKAKKGLLSGKA